jgi:hypothetical protein
VRLAFEIVHRQDSVRVFDSLFAVARCSHTSPPFRGETSVCLDFSLQFSFSLLVLFLIHTRAHTCTQRGQTPEQVALCTCTFQVGRQASGR